GLALLSDSAAGPLPKAKAIAPGAEDPFIRQVVPYIEAYRASWGAVYRVVYDHLTRLPAELRSNYITRLGLEHGSLMLETDFQTIAKYYGVDPRTIGELQPDKAALAALGELARHLIPGEAPPTETPAVIS